MSLKSLIRAAKQRREQAPPAHSNVALNKRADADTSATDQLQFSAPPDESDIRIGHVHVGSIPACFYHRDWLGAADESRLIKCFDTGDAKQWITVKGRRLRSFGAMPGTVHSQMPKILDELIERLTQSPSLWPTALPRPNHALINFYQPGDGILAHQDGPAYEPRVAIVSLGSPCVMRFDVRPPHIDSTERPPLAIALEPRSLLIFNEELYEKYFHSIEFRHSDEIEAASVDNLSMTSELYRGSVDRANRLSITIRASRVVC